MERLDVKPGDTLSVNVGRHRIVLAMEGEEQAPRTPSGPRLVKHCRNR